MDMLFLLEETNPHETLL